LVAYECSPFRGSEWSVGWWRAVQSAKYADTVVLTKAESRADIELHSRAHGSLPGLTIHYVEHSFAQRLLAGMPRLFDYHYLAYNLWQRKAARLAQQLHGACPFDVFHQVNVTTYREPGYLWKQQVPFVWGPIGGTQQFPWAFVFNGLIKDVLREVIRNVVNSMTLRFNLRVRKAVRQASCILAASSQVQADFARCYNVRLPLLLETGIPSIPLELADRDYDQRPLRILWSGRFEHRKALPLLLAAIGQLPRSSQVQVRILGRGPLEKHWKTLARKLSVAHCCNFLGFVPLEQVTEHVRWAHILVFTSLRDTSGNVMLEAMSEGVPVICFDHHGAKDIVDESSGVKIPVTKPSDAIDRLKDAIESLDQDRGLLRRLSSGAFSRAQIFSWDRNGHVMAEIYNSVSKGHTNAWQSRSREVTAGFMEESTQRYEKV
jgi:glycosyltransferase involved in cell wall biosynthesis